MPRQDAHGQTDALDYIQAMLGQLRAMAQAERFEMLSYLIEMAYVEANDIIRTEKHSGIDQKRGDGAA